MMLKINIQLFAHKKGVGSTKNGRDSESKRLGVKRADGQFVLAGNIRFVSVVPITIPARMSVSVPTIRCLRKRTAPFRFERVGKDRKKVSVYAEQ